MEKSQQSEVQKMKKENIQKNDAAPPSLRRKRTESAENGKKWFVLVVSCDINHGTQKIAKELCNNPKLVIDEVANNLSNASYMLDQDLPQITDKQIIKTLDKNVTCLRKLNKNTTTYVVEFLRGVSREEARKITEIVRKVKK
jgi:hypothetical protein